MTPQPTPFGRREEANSIDPDALLDALVDEDCRAIIATLGTGAATIPELDDALGIATSTLYRKMDRLSEGGLLAEEIVFDENGQHMTAYSLRVEEGSLRVDLGDGVDLSFEEERAAEPPGAVGARAD